MSLLNISQGVLARPQKVVIYGPEGIGKSSLAAQFPEPLFIDTEGGTAHLDVRRAECQDWKTLLGMIGEAAQQKICKTLIIDTADWAEQMCVNAILQKYRQTSIEAFGYGKGYTYLQEEFTALLRALDAVLRTGVHCVLTAHAKMRKQELPDEQGAFDRWEMKLSRQVAPLVKEWSDLLLFLNYKTYVVKTDNSTNKAQGGKRVMHTTHRPVWDAKNRHGLPEELELSYEPLRHIFEGAPKAEPPKTAPKAEPVLPATDSKTQLAELMAISGVTEEELRPVLGPACDGKQLSELADRIVPIWDKVLERLNKKGE